LSRRLPRPQVGTFNTALEYRFHNDELRIRALTHRSANPDHNERLEFLGDALLGMLIAEYLFEHFPTADEGQLTRTRASLVNRESLAEIARSIELGSHLILGEGELKSGGWRRDSILANAFEALVGAIYLDGGMDACRRVVASSFARRLAEVDPGKAIKDPKTALQELLQSRHFPLPRYETIDVVGPSHDQVFTVACHTEALPDPVVAEGRSRRKAEQAAAVAALEQLR
jgi:ribonuclease-3